MSSPERRCRATSIRWCCWRAGRRWNGRPARWSTTAAGRWTPARPARLQPRPRRAARDRSRCSDRPGSAGPLAMTSARRSYCVVGGGISGLTAAYRLRQAAGDDASITLFDPADRLGGVLRTELVGGVPWMSAPKLSCCAGPKCRRCWPNWACANEQLGTTGARPLIYSQDRLHPLPAGTRHRHPVVGGVDGRSGQ